MISKKIELKDISLRKLLPHDVEIQQKVISGFELLVSSIESDWLFDSFLTSVLASSTGASSSASTGKKAEPPAPKVVPLIRTIGKPRNADGQAKGTAARENVEETGAEYEAEPVSYTHLTLPTNREV